MAILKVKFVCNTQQYYKEIHKQQLSFVPRLVIVSPQKKLNELDHVAGDRDFSIWRAADLDA